MSDVVILGGGPGGYEAALVAAQLGGQVHLVERDDLGGAAVLTDCVPSKTLIATAEVMSHIAEADQLGLILADGASGVRVDLGQVNRRVCELARAQSRDIRAKLVEQGVTLHRGVGRLDGPREVVVTPTDATDGLATRLRADVVLVATGTTPRELPDAPCDGERVLNWKQVYSLSETPERLIVVGSGVTGAEFASAYHALGSEVVLVSSRDQVLPGHDADAAAVVQRVFESRGMRVLSRCRAVAARRVADGVEVELADGSVVEGSHALMAVGATPNTSGIGLVEAGVSLGDRGHIHVDRVSRTSATGVYAAGDVTGVLALASVAAMQGRIAMWHSLGDAVEPLDLSIASSCVFTSPEIATVGVTQERVNASPEAYSSVTLPLASNARAKMQGLRHGFVKLFCLPRTGIVVGGVVVARNASELIHPIAIAVGERITVEAFSHDFTVYPSLSGSLAEAARQLRVRGAGEDNL